MMSNILFIDVMGDLFYGIEIMNYFLLNSIENKVRLLFFLN